MTLSTATPCRQWVVQVERHQQRVVRVLDIDGEGGIGGDVALELRLERVVVDAHVAAELDARVHQRAEVGIDFVDARLAQNIDIQAGADGLMMLCQAVFFGQRYEIEAVFEVPDGTSACAGFGLARGVFVCIALITAIVAFAPGKDAKTPPEAVVRSRRADAACPW